MTRLRSIINNDVNAVTLSDFGDDVVYMPKGTGVSLDLLASISVMRDEVVPMAHGSIRDAARSRVNSHITISCKSLDPSETIGDEDHVGSGGGVRLLKGGDRFVVPAYSIGLTGDPVTVTVVMGPSRVINQDGMWRAEVVR